MYEEKDDTHEEDKVEDEDDDVGEEQQIRSVILSLAVAVTILQKHRISGFQ